MISVVSKSKLEKGFCQNTSILSSEDYLEALQKLEALIPAEKKLLTISMTSSSILNRFAYCVPPAIRKYSKDIECIFNPNSIWDYCKQGLDEVRPSVDIAIFNTKDEVAIATYSKGAPVLVFTDDNGNIAVGTVFRQQLIQYGEYIFDTIMKYLDENIRVFIPVCTHYVYPDFGTIPQYIKKLALKYPERITGIYVGDDTESSSNLFGSKDRYNNCIIAY